MNRDKIQVKVDVTQLEYGIEYAGSVTLDEHKFKYHLKFNIPINHLTEEGKDSCEPISLKITDSQGRIVPLDSKEKELLAKIPLELAIGIYNSGAAEIFFRDPVIPMYHSGGFLDKDRVKVILEMNREYTLSINQGLENFLETYGKLES
ncbi:MAG: hypothetical protein AABX03_02905 [Nanoarchaeota archaeon]